MTCDHPPAAQRDQSTVSLSSGPTPQQAESTRCRRSGAGGRSPDTCAARSAVHSCTCQHPCDQQPQRDLDPQTCKSATQPRPRLPCAKKDVPRAVRSPQSVSTAQGTATSGNTHLLGQIGLMVLRQPWVCAHLDGTASGQQHGPNLPTHRVNRTRRTRWYASPSRLLAPWTAAVHDTPLSTFGLTF